MTTQKFQSGDFWGGLAATAVVLPQAMAFGVALVGLINIDPATGALAGLLSAAILCLATGIFGGTTGLISSPTGPTLVLISGALLACKAAGVEGPELLQAMTVIMVLTGTLQCLIGLTGGGHCRTGSVVGDDRYHGADRTVAMPDRPDRRRSTD